MGDETIVNEYAHDNSKRKHKRSISLRIDVGAAQNGDAESRSIFRHPCDRNVRLASIEKTGDGEYKRGFVALAKGHFSTPFIMNLSKPTPHKVEFTTASKVVTGIATPNSILLRTQTQHGNVEVHRISIDAFESIGHEPPKFNGDLFWITIRLREKEICLHFANKDQQTHAANLLAHLIETAITMDYQLDHIKYMSAQPSNALPSDN